ncbi:50S ribosomal protein L33, partial [Tetrabaena socialis]
MQSLLKTSAPAMSNPFMGSKMSYRIAAAPAPSTTAFRQVTTMAKKKGVRLIVTVECTEAKGLNATPSRYVTQKNRKNTPERLELKKYNPYLRRHTVHKEV